MKRKIEMIIVHCDANDNPKWGIPELTQAHLDRKMKGIGYHYWINFHGQLYNTRPLATPGEHAKGYNFNSIGVCLHGHHIFFVEQYKTLTTLLVDLCRRYNLKSTAIFPHNKFAKKDCPNFDLTPIKEEVEKLLKGDTK